MKGLIILILIISVSLASFGQPPITRTTPSNTVYDSRPGAIYNFLLPTYFDTTDANKTTPFNNIGLDSVGALIYCYSTQTVWWRQGSPKKWVEITVSGGGTLTNANNGLLLSGAIVQQGGRFIQNTTVSGANLFSYKYDSLTNFTVNALGGSANSSLRLVNDGTIELSGGNARLRYRGDTIISDTRAGYFTNINGSLTANSWITKGYFDSLSTPAATVTAGNNDLTLSGTTLQTGGSLIQNTTTTSTAFTRTFAFTNMGANAGFNLTQTGTASGASNTLIKAIQSGSTSIGQRTYTSDLYNLRTGTGGANVGLRITITGKGASDIGFLVPSGFNSIGDEVQPISKLNIVTNGMGASPADTSALALFNATGATALVPVQVSTPLWLQGNGWKTDATAGSENTTFKMWTLPIQGTAHPTANLKFVYTLNAGLGGSDVNVFGINSVGALLLGASNDAGASGQVLISNGTTSPASWINQSSIVGAVPTLQQVITKSPVLTDNNIIDGGNLQQTFTNNDIFRINTKIGSGTNYAELLLGDPDDISMVAYDGAGMTSTISVVPDSVYMNPHLGRINIDTLRSATTQNRFMVWGGNGNGMVASATPGYGLSFASGLPIADTSILMNKAGAQVGVGIKNWTSLQKFSAGLNLSSTAAPLQVNGSAGSAGQVLTSAGAGATPTWAVIATDYWNAGGTTNLSSNPVTIEMGDKTLTFHGSDPAAAFVVDGANLGINVPVPTVALDVLGGINFNGVGGNYQMSADNAGNIDINASGAARITFDPANGFLTLAASTKHFINGAPVQMDNYTAGAATFDGSGNITSVSDRRAKHDIKDFKLGLKEILNVHPASFIYNQDKSNTVMQGFIAQDIQSAFYGAGVYSKPDSKGKESMLSLNTNIILAALVNAVQEQQREIEYLKTKIK